MAEVERLLVRYPLTIRRRLPVLLLTLASMLMLTLCFEPFAQGWLGWAALAPWLIAVATSRRWGWMLFCSWLGGFLFYACNLYWLLACGRGGPWGDMALMAGAQLALSAYQGLYFLLFAYVVGGLMRRWSRPGCDGAPSGLLLTYVAPIAWVGIEVLQGHMLSGFTWFLLGYSQYNHPLMMQLADLCEAYTVSFLLAAVNGLIADGMLLPLFRPTRKGPRPNYRVSAAALAVLGLLLASLVYGRYRLCEVDLSARPGPRVAVVQGYFPINLKGDSLAELARRYDAHMGWTAAALADRPRPDQVAWPETMVGLDLNDDFLRREWAAPADPALREKYAELLEMMAGIVNDACDMDATIRQTAARNQTALLIGAHAAVPAPSRPIDQPMDLLRFYYLWRVDEPVGQPGPGNPQVLSYNSAYQYQPRIGSTQPDDVTQTRYDKHHLVPFGETLPFRRSWPAAFRLLRKLTPMDLLIPGENIGPLELRTRDGREFRFAVPICYEDAVPQATRDLAYGPGGRKKIDYLVNISNDGWFAGTTELRQHAAQAAFRCVANRVPMARSVNCGCSGFFDSVGRPMGMLAPGTQGHLSAVLPLDSRQTLYGWWGDWPAVACAALLAVGLATVMVRRRRCKKLAKANR